MSSNTKIRLLIIVAVMLVCIYGIIGLPTSNGAAGGQLEEEHPAGTGSQGRQPAWCCRSRCRTPSRREADTVIQRLQDELAKASVPFADMSRNDPQTFDDANNIQINIKGVPATKAGDFRTIVNDNFGAVWILTPVNQTDYRLTMKPSEALKLRADTLTQSINTIEKKINGLGLAESSVQQRGGNRRAEFWCSCRAWTIRRASSRSSRRPRCSSCTKSRAGRSHRGKKRMQSKNGVLPLSSQILPSSAPRRRARRVSTFWRARRSSAGSDLRDAKPVQNGQNGGWETQLRADPGRRQALRALHRRAY